MGAEALGEQREEMAAQRQCHVGLNLATLTQTISLLAAAAPGTIKLVSHSGRVGRSLEAHQGATLCLRWSLDGAAFASGGEDGAVRGPRA